MVVEVIDAPWAGFPARFRWFKRRWICREHTCQTMTFLEHDERMCAPRARLGTRVIRWAIRQLRFEGATIAGLARQLATTWNTVWSHIKPCLQAASDDPARFAGVQVLGVDEHVWHHQNRRRRGPRELTGIVDLTRGKDHPTARLLDLVPGRSGTAYKNWLEERGEDFRSGIQIATLDPFQGYKNAIDDQLQDATSVLDAFHIVKLTGVRGCGRVLCGWWCEPSLWRGRSYPCSQSHTHPGSQLTVVARTRDRHQCKSVPGSRFCLRRGNLPH